MSKRNNKSKNRKPLTNPAEKKAKVVKATKIVKTTTETTERRKTSSARTSTRSRASRNAATKSALYSSNDMMFGKQNYILMAAGLGVIIIGFLLMVGGKQPDPNTWDADIIYGFQRTVLAPFIVLIGLVIEIIAIFKVDKQDVALAEE